MTKLEEIYNDLRELRRSVGNIDDAVVVLRDMLDEFKRKVDTHGEVPTGQVEAEDA